MLRAALLATLALLSAPAAADDAVPAPASRGEALEGVVDDDWRVRVSALRALLEHTRPGDEPLLAAALSDPRLPVAQAAADALAALGTAEAITHLETMLAASDAQRREAAALALLVHLEPAALEPGLEARARLQVVSEVGRRWLEARAVYLEIRALRDDHADALADLAALYHDPAFERACLVAEAAILGVELEGLVEDPQRAERFWQEGRLDRLTDERIRLTSAVRAAPALREAALERCVSGPTSAGGLAGGAAPPPTTPPDDPGTPFAAFLQGDFHKGQGLLLRVHGFFGHDNHTFLLNPALRVSEPGPRQGEPIDLERDDTFGGGWAQFIWLIPTVGQTVRGSPVLPPELRANLVTIALRSGYDGRLRWGQLMGQEGELEVTVDHYEPRRPDALERWRGGVRGGVFVPDWRDEHDLTVAPVQRVGGRARFDWSDVAVAPTLERDGIDRLRIGVESEGWAAAHEADAAQGIEPPENWWMHYASDLDWHFVALDDARETWLGLTGGVATRLSDGDFGHGAAAHGGLRLSAIFNEYTQLWFEAGYGAALPYGDADAQARTGPVRVAIAREVEHAPVLGAHYVTREVFDGAFMQFALDLEHRVELAGRYGWVAERDRAHVGMDMHGPLGTRYTGLSLFVERAHYPRGEVVSDLLGVPLEGRGDVELVVAGFDVLLPLWFESWFHLGVLGEGRLASSSARFDGRFEGQFRVQAVGTLLWDILESEGLSTVDLEFPDF